MSDTLGPMTLGRAARTRVLPFVEAGERDFSEETARRIDAEIKSLLDGEHERARHKLEEKRIALEAIASELLNHETLQGNELEVIVRGKKSNGRSCDRLVSRSA